MKKYLIVFEKTETGYSAYSPDVVGCVAAGKTRRQAEKNMHEALMMHIKGLLEDNLPLPAAAASSEYVLLNEKTLVTA